MARYLISIIIPVLSDHKAPYIQKRLLALLDYIRNLHNTELEIVVVDYSPQASALIKQKCNAYIKEDLDGVFNPVKARNLAVHQARGEYLFLHDVDLMYDATFYDSLVLEARRLKKIGAKVFAMLPCLYLTLEGTEKLQAGSLSYDELRESYLRGEADLVSHIAACSSAILVTRDYYLKLGGMDESFQGHGCEDFDFIHKLVVNQPIAMRDEDYYQDVVAQFPVNYQGFRKFMVYYSLPYLFTPMFLVHLYHDRPLSNLFYFNRRNNERHLQRNMRSYVGQGHRSSVPQQPLADFITQLMSLNEFDVSEYPGLFQYKAGVTGRKGNFGSKLRKLITKPGLFITDSKFYRIIFKK
ncbi:MAG: putative glycosyltransferase involved in capsule biosynthesis [Oleiphilaceae bacterium]